MQFIIIDSGMEDSFFSFKFIGGMATQNQQYCKS